jgi:hypothetical protein
MQHVVNRAERSRRARWSFGVVVALIAAFGLAACGGSSSSSSSASAGSSSTSSASNSSSSSSGGSLKTGLNVYVIPKNLGNNYFTVADSVKTGGALAALQALGEKGTETSGGRHGSVAAAGDPGVAVQGS